MKQKKGYVVYIGRVPGVYTNWPDCKEQVDGYVAASHQGFDTMEEAEEAWQYFIDTRNVKQPE